MLSSLVIVTLLQSPAYGAGVAGGVGVAVFQDLDKKIEDTPDVEFDSEPMIGPVVSVALRGGDWVDHQLVVQWLYAKGPISVTATDGGTSAEGTLSSAPIGGG